jgi:hypothetical protein
MSKIAHLATIAAASIAFVEASDRCLELHQELQSARRAAGMPTAPIFPCPAEAPAEVRAAFDVWCVSADAETFARRAMEKAVKAYRESKEEARPDAAAE